ncbi:M48 family metallopeptidase [Tessaracoccus sp. OS52]|uniref:M48 family metallopeptidase n=1 Tax=Tessaracoccus sp. OS52 TaxID=2886691 RepID=UPI001D126662|nr:SprT family zinc-dependent metalloprotease [Tessaracoccus sp. OS52]MCC2592652.1 M48 family metallopeptidase [Tessaracoccus sp. OS52]
MSRIGSRYLLRTSGVEVQVTLKRMKNLRMRVDPSDASIRVSAPWHVGRAEIEEFVGRNAAWAVEAQTRARMNAPERLVSGGRARLWGRWHELVVVDGARAVAAFEEDRIRITRPEGDEDAARRALTALHRRELAPAIDHYLQLHSPYVGRGPSRIRLARMRSRWGSCNQVTGAMSFSIALAERPREQLEYVVVHELAHLLEANHGPDFKAHLGAMLPDWRSRDAQLKGRL